MFFAVNIHAAANFYNYYGDIMPSLSLRFTTGSDPIPTGFSVPFRLRLNSHFLRFGSKKASGNTCYVHIQTLPGCTDFFGKLVSVNIWLTFGVIRCHRLPHSRYTSVLFQAVRDLLSAAFPPTQLYYFLRLSVFVNEPFRSKAQKLLAQVMRKRQLQLPSTMTQLLLPPLHVQNWKVQLGTWLQRWVASHRDLFPSLFLPKIRVVETRSATLGDRIYNYRSWQRRWISDTSFPCRCSDMDACNLFRAHDHAVIVDEFSRINADIDLDTMTASMKDQYFGDVDMPQQRFTMQLRRLARRWHIHGTSFPTDFQPVLTELIDAHRSNIQDHAHWTSASLQRTVVSLSSWVVISADHVPSRAHVICPSLFATLMHKTFCTGDVFSLCRESAASFCSEVVTTIPALLQQRYAWGLRLQAPLPTARILPKPTKDWLKARPIISFFCTWAAPSSRSSAPSSLNSPKSPFQTYQVNFRFRS